MSYVKERDEFISIMTGEGLSLEVTRKLLRYAQTLHRLAVAQCNGDWPYNGDRDRPNALKSACAMCDAHGKVEGSNAECGECSGSGWTWHRDVKADERHDRRYTVCPKCEASGVSRSAMRWSAWQVLSNPDNPKDKVRTRERICPDCRTVELVQALVQGLRDNCKHDSKSMLPVACTCAVEAVFGGDPRGCVLKVKVPSGRNNSWGSEDPAICVPVRDR